MGHTSPLSVTRHHSRYHRRYDTRHDNTRTDNFMLGVIPRKVRVCTRAWRGCLTHHKPTHPPTASTLIHTAFRRSDSLWPKRLRGRFGGLPPSGTNTCIVETWRWRWDRYARCGRTRARVRASERACVRAPSFLPLSTDNNEPSFPLTLAEVGTVSPWRPKSAHTHAHIYAHAYQVRTNCGSRIPLKLRSAPTHTRT